MTSKKDLEVLDPIFMKEALEEARLAFKKNEVPVGAVLVRDNKILARAHNLRQKSKDPLSHAEVLVIKEASKKEHSWRLEDTTLYVSLEPCLMCVGALLQARVKRLVYAVKDEKLGFSSFYGLDKLPSWRHKLEIRELNCELSLESSSLLKEFFKGLRSK